MNPAEKQVRLITCALAMLACAAFLSGGQPAPAQQARQMPKARVAERVKGFDANGDGKITREEFRGPAGIFRLIDKNGDGVIDEAELSSFAAEKEPLVLPAPAGGGDRKGANKRSMGEKVGGIAPDVKPLSEMAAEDKYQGEDGGLYGQGRNEPPAEHLAAALKAAREIQPLDQDGKPAQDGKVGFISFGMSNTTQEFQRFQQMIKPLKLAPALVVVDGAQGGQEARAWATSERPWTELARRLKEAGVAPRQVQVAWIKQAVAGPARDGGFPAHIRKFEEYMVTDLQKLKILYPNLRLVYVSNRIYAGYAVTQLNPEPYAYEYAYGLRGLILDQISGKPELNADPAKGAVKAPLILWGPDLWANGEQARRDGLKWTRDDLGPDGTHPSDSGREKVAGQLLHFLQTDPTARLWFVGK